MKLFNRQSVALGLKTFLVAALLSSGLTNGALALVIDDFGQTPNHCNYGGLVWWFETYQAEDGDMVQAIVEDEVPGYTGSGYVDFQTSNGDFLVLGANVPLDGYYDLSFRYALNGADREMQLEVDFNVVDPAFNFPDTESWTNWSSVNICVYMDSGYNTIQLTATGDSGPNLDYMMVRAAVEVATQVPRGYKVIGGYDSDAFELPVGERSNRFELDPNFQLDGGDGGDGDGGDGDASHFLAGGEFPVPVPQGSAGDSGDGDELGHRSDRPTLPSPEAYFLRGDSNSDGGVDLSDATETFVHLYLGGEEPDCMDAADTNDDGTVDLADGMLIMTVLFLGTGEIPPPGPATCGPDPTADRLTCIRMSCAM